MKAKTLPLRKVQNASGTVSHPRGKTAEIAAHQEVHATQVTSWKNESLENLAGIFGGESCGRDEKERVLR